MKNNFIEKFLSKIKKNKNKISIIGRGPSSRFYLNRNELTIGVNIKEINNININYILRKNKLINLKDNTFVNLNNFFGYKIGSVPFSLLNLLELLNSFKKYMNVKMYGFDFKKFSNDDDIYKEKRINKDIDGIQENIDINTQLFAFNTYKNKYHYLDINRFGFDFYSNFKKQVKPKSLEVISEFTTNHQGDTERLDMLIKSCINAKCKTIKFQRRDVENFYDKETLKKKYITPISKNFYEYRKNLEFNEEQLDLIAYYKKSYDLKVIFSALDVKSYLELKKKKFKYFKIPSTISEHKKFINFLANERNQLTYISTGMTDQKYVNYILNKFKNQKVVLMHAVSAYPTKFENINLNIITKYKELSEKNNKIRVGYSSHDVGYLGSMLAIAAGATVIEKHIKLGHTHWMHFDDTAIDAKLELPLFIENLNKTFVSMGNKKKKVYNFEHHKYRYIKK